MGKIDTFVALDIEATGISPNKSRIIEIGAIKVVNGREVDKFVSLVNPCVPLSPQIEDLTGITNHMLENAPYAKEVLKNFLVFCEDYPWLGHSISSDYGYMKAELLKNNMLKDSFKKYGYDTLAISRKLLPGLKSKSLKSMCEYYGINNEREHRALSDVRATIRLFESLQDEFYIDNKESFKQGMLIYKVKKIQKITNWQKNYLNDLIKCHKISFSGNVEKLTMSEASQIIDKIILIHGRMI